MISIIFFTLFTNAFVYSSKYSTPLRFVEEPSDLLFSSQNSGYLHCVAKATSNDNNDQQITITWRFLNGSVVRNVSSLIVSLPNGSLWFKPFHEHVEGIHNAKYQCIANLTLHNQAILSKPASVKAVVLTQFDVMLRDQYVQRSGFSVSFRCIYPDKVKSYVKVAKWFVNKEPLKVAPKDNLVVKDVQKSDSDKLYFCVVVNILTNEMVASNVAKIFIRNSADIAKVPLKFKLVPENRTVVEGEQIEFECLVSKTNVLYTWIHNNITLRVSNRYRLINGRLKILKASLADTGQYFCIVRDQTTQEEISSSATLVVRVPLKFVTNFTKICTTYHVNATFSCDVSGYPSPRIIWYKNAKEIKNNTKIIRNGTRLIITSTWGRDKGIYQCIASNGFETIHQAASLIVGTKAPIIVEAFEQQNLSFSSKLDISCKAVGKEQLSLIWYKDGIIIEKTNDLRINLKHYHDLWTLQIKNLTAADSGLYRCEVLNRAGSNHVEAAILVKGPAIITNLPNKISGRLGKHVKITCKAQGFPQAQITWYDNNGLRAPSGYRHKVLNSKGESTLIIKKMTEADAGRYKCDARGQLGFSDEAFVKLSVNRSIETYELIILEEGTRKTFVCHRCIKWTFNNVIDKTRISVKKVLDMCILNLDDIIKNDAGKYTCYKKVDDEVSKEVTEIFVITIPRFTRHHSPNFTSVVENNDITLRCGSSGFPRPRTTWRRQIGGNFEEIVESSRFQLIDDGSLKISNVTLQDERDYSCEISNSHRSRADLTITLNVNIPAKIINWRYTEFAIAGNKTNLYCEGIGEKRLEITWFKNQQELFESTNLMISRVGEISVLTLLRVTRKDAGKYICKIFNSFGKDEKSLELRIRDKPDPPILDKYKNEKRSVTIYWTPSFDGESPITGYTIVYEGTTYPFIRKHIAIAATNSCKIAQLEPYTEYKVWIKAKNDIGLSKSSNAIYVQTAQDVPSAAPKMFFSRFTKSLRIKWTRLSVNDANGIITKYVIWWKEKFRMTESFKMKIIRHINRPETTLLSLKPYTHYAVKIQAFTKVGPGPNSSVVIQRTLEGVPSQSPKNVMIIGRTSTKLTVQWNKPPEKSINGILTGYRVYYFRKPKGPKSWIDVLENETSVAIANLEIFSNYTIQVSALTSQGPGKQSSQLNARTDEDIPGPPTDLRATTTSLQSIKLSWSQPNKPNGRITNYKIYFVNNVKNLERKHSYNIHHVEGTKIEHEFENLSENRTYYFWVCAKTSKGEGNCTKKVIASTSRGPPSFINDDNGHKIVRWKHTAVLKCHFSGYPLPTISWLDINGKPIVLSHKYHINKDNYLVVKNVDRRDSTRYYCKVKNKWGAINKSIILKVQAPPDPPKSIRFSGVSRTSVKLTWINGFKWNADLTNIILNYKQKEIPNWVNISIHHNVTECIVKNIKSARSYFFRMKAVNEIGEGNFSGIQRLRFKINDGVLEPVEEEDDPNKEETALSPSTIFKDSAVIGTLIGVSVFIILVVIILALLTNLGLNPMTKLQQRSVKIWRWFVTKGISKTDRRGNLKRRSDGSSTDGHLGGSSSSLSQGPASYNGSTFSLPRTSSRITESGYATGGYPPIPFGNFTPGPNGGPRASGSSDEGIGPETCGDIKSCSVTETRQTSSIPCRSGSNGTPAPTTLMMNSREYIDPEEFDEEINTTENSQTSNLKVFCENTKIMENSSPTFTPRGKEKVYFQSWTPCVSLNMSSVRPKYEDGHFIVGPDVDHILAYRPPRCYDSTSSEYSSSRDELAQAYEFGKLHHLDDHYGRPTLESASSSGETTGGSEKDGICHFSSELSIGRPFLIPVAILPPPPNHRFRTRKTQQLNTFYEKDETLV